MGPVGVPGGLRWMWMGWESGVVGLGCLGWLWVGAGTGWDGLEKGGHTCTSYDDGMMGGEDCTYPQATHPLDRSGRCIHPPTASLNLNFNPSFSIQSFIRQDHAWLPAPSRDGCVG